MLVNPVLPETNPDQAVQNMKTQTKLYYHLGAAQWVARQTPSLVMWRSWVQALSKAPVVSLSKKLYPYCLVLVGSRNGFKREFTIELK